MDTLPTGTVTMVFTDIEGSTVMLGRLGDRYTEALSAHRTLLRAAFARWCGVEIRTEGDSFFVVFESACDAVRGCLDAQRALGGHDWPDGPMRVRMGIHTGELSRHEDDYVGMDVHRAARIAATAHGGQVVLSDVTRQLVGTGLPDDVQFRDLGWHRLKDLTDTERIHQLAAPGLDADFPPLKSLGTQANLPVPPTPLVGRAEELARVRGCLLKPDVRLVTLTGPGGSGKTRLALALAASVAQHFPAGVFFVPLAVVTGAEVMWAAIADAVGVTADGTTAVAVTGHLSGRNALLVLDNLEQIPDAPDVVSVLLTAAPTLSLLATSRRPLHLQGEYEHPVPPLALPGDTRGDLADVAASGAVQLFVQQAAMVRRGFSLTDGNAADVAAVCTRLDGLPLAIELAASRAKLLAPRALLSRLDHCLGLTAGDAGRPTRQQTLRNTIAWSHDLLTPDLQRVFRRTGVFAGGADLDALAAVALDEDGVAAVDPLDLVAELVDVSLVTIGEGVDGEPRVGLLETIREFALERLVAAGELDAVRRRHAEHYLALVERLAPELHGSHQLMWLDRLEAEHDNLRAALSWSLEGDPPPGSEPDDRVTLGLRLVNALSWFWYAHGHAVDARRWLERATDLAGADEGPELASALHGSGVLLLQQGELDAARTALERSLALWRRLGDAERVAIELSSLGAAHRLLGDLFSARRLLHESIDISREHGKQARLATALSNLACVEIDADEPERAMVLLREALVIDRRANDSWAVAVDQGNLAGALLLAGQAEDAQELLCSIISNVVGLRDVELLADTLERFAAVAAALGADARAARLVGAAESIRRRAGMPLSSADAALLERTLAGARAGMEPQAWERESAAGRRLTSDQAVALAVQPLPTVHAAGTPST